MAGRAKKSKAAEPIVAYKGFSKDLTCNGYQFEIGKTFTHEGKVEACASGLNSANRENPFVEWLDPRSIALVMDDRPDLYDELRAPEPRGLGWAWFVIIAHALLWTAVLVLALRRVG